MLGKLSFFLISVSGPWFCASTLKFPGSWEACYVFWPACSGVSSLWVWQHFQIQATAQLILCDLALTSSKTQPVKGHANLPYGYSVCDSDFESQERYPELSVLLLSLYGARTIWRCSDDFSVGHDSGVLAVVTHFCRNSGGAKH